MHLSSADADRCNIILPDSGGELQLLLEVRVQPQGPDLEKVHSF